MGDRSLHLWAGHIVSGRSLHKVSSSAGYALTGGLLTAAHRAEPPLPTARTTPVDGDTRAGAYRVRHE